MSSDTPINNNNVQEGNAATLQQASTEIVQITPTPTPTPTPTEKEEEESRICLIPERSNNKDYILTPDEVKNIVIRHMNNKEKARVYKREYSRRKRQELKNYIETLETKQIKGAEISMIVSGGEKINVVINSEQQYVKFLNDLLGTLQDNSIVLEYSVKSE